MAAPNAFSTFGADALLAEQQRLRALVYSRQAENEPSRQHLDASTGQLVQLRENEWLLLQLEREVQRRAQAPALPNSPQRDPEPSTPLHDGVPDAAAAASAPNRPLEAPVTLPRGLASEPPSAPPPQQQPHQQPRPQPEALTPEAHKGAGWARVALIFAAGLALGTVATMAATGALRVPGFAGFAPAPSASPVATAPLPVPTQHAELLQIFAQGDTRAPTIPAMLNTLFPPEGIAIIYAPAAGNTGTRVYAARPNARQLCLIASIPTQQLAWRCGDIEDVARSGLHLRFWLADGLQQPPTTLGDGLDHTPTIADASWNADGSFSVAQTPYG